LGLFDIFSKSKEERPKSDKDVARLERLVANKLSQNYDRQEAIEELSKIGSAASARALLKRFNWSLDPSITDQEEKETCLRGIVAAGEDALEPLREYCKKAESLTWALKVLKGIVPEERLVEELLSLLDQFDTEYTRNVEPKVQLLRALEEYPSEDVFGERREERPRHPGRARRRGVAARQESHQRTPRGTRLGRTRRVCRRDEERAPARLRPRRHARRSPLAPAYRHSLMRCCVGKKML
jgi:hypothetical protein